jgi:hypothetical protein
MFSENENNFFTELEQEFANNSSLIAADPNDVIKYAQDEQLQIAKLTSIAARDTAGQLAVEAVAALYEGKIASLHATSLIASHASLYQGPNQPTIQIEGGLYVDGRMNEFIYAQLFGQRTIALVLVNALIETEHAHDIELSEKAAPVLVPVLSINTYSYL